jgi:predicted ATPase
MATSSSPPATVFLLFGAPIAHEDHPQRALYAALRIQADMSRNATALREAGVLPIEARVGVNVGEVVVRSLNTGEGQFEYAPIGHSLSLAARMQALAPTGSIAATEATRRLCEGYFIFKLLGPAQVKGVTGTITVYEVTGMGALRTHFQASLHRGLTKFAGRRHELEQMSRAFEMAKTGHGGVVALLGDPGMEKSRLLYEFKAMAGSDATVLEAFATAHGKGSSYLPVIELLRGYFEITLDDDQRKRRERILGKVLGLDRALEDTLIYLYLLFGIAETADTLTQMDPQIRRRRTQNAIMRILLRESLNKPLIVIVEDLHWVDSETQALLNLLVDGIANARILMLVNYRPEYHHEWGNRSNYTQVRLGPLAPEDAAEMLSALLGDNIELGPIKRLIAQKTQGNPFFVEEIVQALFEQGFLARDGEAKITRPLIEIKVPPTVQAVLASRIDRLLSDDKELLQTLAVIGREFTLPLARALSGRPEAELDRILRELQRGEFIHEQPAFPEPEYIFKHALTQEVAYNSVLTERRKLLHERTAIAIEALYEGRLEPHFAELAHHYRHSGDIEKAVYFLKRAAEQAAEQSALTQAQDQLNEAIALLQALPSSANRDVLEIGLQTTLSVSLVGRGWGAPDREAPLRRAYELCGRVADAQLVVPPLYQLGQLYIEQMRLTEAREVTGTALRLAQNSTDKILQLGAWPNLGETYFWNGEPHEAREYLMRAFAICENISPQALIRIYGVDHLILTTIILALTNVVLGLPDSANCWEQRALERAASSSHPYSRALAIVAAGLLSPQLKGDLNRASEYTVSALQFCRNTDFTSAQAGQKA